MHGRFIYKKLLLTSRSAMIFTEREIMLIPFLHNISMIRHYYWTLKTLKLFVFYVISLLTLISFFLARAW